MLGSMEACDDLIASQEITSGDKTQVVEAWKAVGVYANKVGYDFVRCTTYTSQSTETLLEAINTIRAGEVCGLGSANIVESGATLHYKAGVEIRLKNNFSARQGSSFRASIEEPCTSFFPKVAYNASSARVGSHTGNRHAAEAVLAPVVWVAPNPTESVATVWISLGYSSTVSVEFVDLLGQRWNALVDVREAQVGTHQLHVPLLGLPPGMYQCKLTTSRHTTTTMVQVLR